MTAMRGRGHAAAVLAALLATACAPAAKRPTAPPPAAEIPASQRSFEAQQLARAEAFSREQRWGEAAVHWQILALLRPDRVEYRQRAEEASARLERETSQRLQSAAEARRRGDTDQASLLYLKALSLDPTNATAFQSLRQIERERAARNNQSKTSRATPLARAARDTTPRTAAAAPYPAERRELDYGVMLFHQGDYAASIKALEIYLQGAPRDELGRRYLADACIRLGQQRLQQGRKEEALALFDRAEATAPGESAGMRETVLALRKGLAEDFYQEGLRAYNTDIRRAIDSWERSLKYDPQHLQARMRLRQARQMEKNLESMDNRPASR